MEIYINGNVFDREYTIHDGFVVENGKFIYIGNKEEALTYAGTVIDLHGHYVLPGFNDSHMHLVGYGQSLKNLSLVSYSDSLHNVLQYVASNLPSDGWLVGRGWNQDYFQDEKRYITRNDLDSISKSIPICLTRACGHILVANSKAISLACIPESLEGGSIDLEKGIFKENALACIYEVIETTNIEQIKEYIVLAQKQLHRYGITSVQSDDLVSVTNRYQDVIDAYQQLERENRLTVRVYQQSQLLNENLLEEFIDKGYRTGVGTEYFKIGPLKMLGDGSLGARTAFLSQPYYDLPSTTGIPVYSKEQLYRMFLLAHTNQLQIAVHAIGDGILDWILDAYQQILNEHPKDDHRHGIVHCQIMRKDQIEKICKLKLHGYFQSVFLDYDNHIIEQRVRPDIANTSYNYKTLLENTTVSNGSDCPVELPDVLKGIQLAVTRTSIDGTGPFLMEQSLTVQEAIDSFTKFGAYASFEEHIKGSIQVGMLADFVVLDKDILKEEVQKIKDIQVLQTYVGGRLVYERGNEND